MKKILIILGRYLPGYKGGGPGRSVANLVDALGDEYEFSVACYDRDLGDKEPYSGISISNWNVVGKANVYYVPENGYSIKCLRSLYQNADLIYLCGCFDSYAIKTLVMNRFGLVKKPIIIASMGLFSPLAFRIKYKKKKFFTLACNLLGMFSNIDWSLTSEMEISEITQQVKTNGDFYIAQDIPRVVKPFYVDKKKKKNILNVAFISRISRKKNLICAIKILRRVNCNFKINFSIYGPNEDIEYWNECLLELELLPENIVWEAKGPVHSDEVISTLQNEHIFLFPTLGENYGHVIQEALSAGCPCVLSEHTPWNDLEENKVGFAFPLDDLTPYVEAVEMYAQMSETEYQEIANRAVDFAIKKSDVNRIADGYRKMFNAVIEKECR